MRSKNQHKHLFFGFLFILFSSLCIYVLISRYGSKKYGHIVRKFIPTPSSDIKSNIDDESLNKSKDIGKRHLKDRDFQSNVLEDEDTENITNNPDVKRSNKDRRGKYPRLIKALGNYEPRHSRKVEGPGEYGRPHVVLPSKTYMVAMGMAEYAMNIACSDEISPDRSIPDTRPDECQHLEYPQNMPQATVIIRFYNEGFSTLMRTVHSVMNRSPPELLLEVLLVDDFSDKKLLGFPLDKYIDRWQGKVRILRMKKRLGIAAIPIAVREAKGEVLVFLDAHCEVNLNWLTPLLAPIHRQKNTIAVPIIDFINHKDFEYRSIYPDGMNPIGIFDWGLLYKESQLPEIIATNRSVESEPYESPTFGGEMFAINKQFFIDLGEYDRGIIAGGGNGLELSFKTWMCGGKILWIPCSRVGHIYRMFTPYSIKNLVGDTEGPFININYRRIVETWFDKEHKEFFYIREPLARFAVEGDLTEQLELKDNLKCNNFTWYMENVAQAVYPRYPKLPKNDHVGTIRNVEESDCLDVLRRDPPSYLTIAQCNIASDTQRFRLNKAGQLANGENCIEANNVGVYLQMCTPGLVHGPWLYSTDSMLLWHRYHHQCLGIRKKLHQVKLVVCDPNDKLQQWTFNETLKYW